MEKEDQVTWDNHFIPEFLLKNWSRDKKNVCMYRRIISHYKIDPWKNSSVGGVAYVRGLYTVQKNGKADDSLEKFFDHNIENCTKSIIAKIINNEVSSFTDLSNDEQHKLICFVAVQLYRTPQTFIEWLGKEHLEYRFSLERLKERYYGFIDCMVKYLYKDLAIFTKYQWHIIKVSNNISLPIGDNSVVLTCGTLTHGEIIFPLSPRFFLYADIENKTTKEQIANIQNNQGSSFKVWRRIIQDSNLYIYSEAKQQEIQNHFPPKINAEKFKEISRLFSSKNNALSTENSTIINGFAEIAKLSIVKKSKLLPQSRLFVADDD